MPDANVGGEQLPDASFGSEQSWRAQLKISRGIASAMAR